MYIVVIVIRRYTTFISTLQYLADQHAGNRNCSLEIFVFNLKSYFFIVRKNILEAHSFCWVSLCKKLLEACGNPIKLVIIFIFEGQIHGVNFPVLLNAASQAFTVTCVSCWHNIHSKLKNIQVRQDVVPVC